MMGNLEEKVARRDSIPSQDHSPVQDSSTSSRFFAPDHTCLLLHKEVGPE